VYSGNDFWLEVYVDYMAGYIFEALMYGAPVAASAAAGGVEGAPGVAAAGGAGGGFPAAAAKVERIVILGDQRYTSAAVAGVAAGAGALEAGAYTRPLISSTGAFSDIK